MTLALPLTSEAVTLGDLTVKSYLNQPLDAYIRLIDINGVPLSGIKVRLASPEAFKRANLPRPYSLSKLTFKVTKRYGKPIVKVSSLERIDEPFMTFLLDLTWAKGQYYRTYTVLLDPPGYDLALERKPPPPRMPVISKQDSHVIAQATKQPISSDYVKTPLPVNEIKLVTKTFGPVKAKDDLWKIAMRYKPANITVYQVMIALLAFNEEGFTSGNINGLKTGVILEIPSYNVMASIPADKAKLEVEAQSRAWKQNKPPVHVLDTKYLKRTYYEKKSQSGFNVKTSYLPALKMGEMKPKQNTLSPSTKDNNPTPSVDKKSLEQADEPLTTTQSSLPKEPVSGTLKIVNKESAKEQLFDDFIPIPQVLTKIVKTPPNAKKKMPSIDATETSPPSQQFEANSTSKKDIAPELAVAASAIATVKESNTLLRDQVKTLLKQNELLKQEALNEKKSVEDLKKKIDTLTRMMTKHYEVNEKGEFVRRKAVKSTNFVEEESSPIYWILLSLLAIMILSAGGAYGLFYLAKQGLLFNLKSDEEKEADKDDKDFEELESSEPVEPTIKPAPMHSETKTGKEQTVLLSEPPQTEEKNETETPFPTQEESGEAHADDEETSDEPQVEYELPDEEDEFSALPESEDILLDTEDKTDVLPSQDQSSPTEDDDHVLEFEPGLAPKVEKGEEQDVVPSKPEVVEDNAEGFIFEAEQSTQTEDNKNQSVDSAEEEITLTLTPLDDSQTETTSQISEEGLEKEDKSLTISPVDESTSEASSVSDDVSENESKASNESNRVKASTQLALAETYMSMEDNESAKSALEDVLETGNEKQKERAKTLLARLDDKTQ